jgi:hypothetical protein
VSLIEPGVVDQIWWQRIRSSSPPPSVLACCRCAAYGGWRRRPVRRVESLERGSVGRAKEIMFKPFIDLLI